MGWMTPRDSIRVLGTTRAIPQQRVLLVDDDPAILTTLKQTILEWLEGIEVYTAPSGERALEILAREPVDLMIVDKYMPGMDGVAFLSAARQICPATPSILISGRPDIDLALDALRKVPVCAFLPKPLRLESVVVAVAGLLHRHGTNLRRREALASALHDLKKELGDLRRPAADAAENPADFPSPKDPALERLDDEWRAEGAESPVDGPEAD